jgi:osmoprotectant transport system permease protein
MSVRETRISAEVAVELQSFGLSAWALALFPILLLVWAIRKTRWIWYAAITCGLIVPIVLFAVYGPQWVAQAGPFARYSPSGGFYVWLLGVGSVLFLKPKRTRYDYLCIILAVLVAVFFSFQGNFDQLGIVQEASNFKSRLSREVGNHIRITLISIGISTLIGLPVALLTYQVPSVRNFIFPLLNILQTIPAIALFGLLIAPLAALSRAFPQLRAMGIQGIGNTPAIIALSIYGIYPILRYSYTAFSEIDTQVIQAARGIGMNRRQIWALARIPLAAPTVLHGIRVALVQTIGNATLAKLIGGGGLGVLVFEGLGQASSDMVLLGMMLIILLTVIADTLALFSIRLLTPKAFRLTKAQHEE